MELMCIANGDILLRNAQEDSIVRRISLAEFAAEKGQTKAAELLGLYQSALSKAIKSGRDIQVIENEDGSFVAEETRKFPASAKSVA